MIDVERKFGILISGIPNYVFEDCKMYLLCHNSHEKKNLIQLSKNLCKHLFLKILFIYLRERAQTGGAAYGEEEADSPLNREPNIGLDPRTLRS